MFSISIKQKNILHALEFTYTGNLLLLITYCSVFLKHWLLSKRLIGLWFCFKVESVPKVRVNTKELALYNQYFLALISSHDRNSLFKDSLFFSCVR